MTNLFLIAAAEGSTVVNELPVEPWVYGAVVFAIFMFLLLATLSLRSVNKQPEAPGGDVIVRNRPGLNDNNTTQN